MSSKGFWERAFADWPAKILSLAAALLLFLFYRLNRLEERYLSVPLAVETNGEYVPASPYPRSIRITLRGEAGSLYAVEEGDIRAVLDLSDRREEGMVKCPVTVEKFGSALGIDPLEIRVEPAELSLTLERRATRIVPVTPAFRGYLEPGYELLSFELAPPEVEIAGPASAVARMRDVTTEPIELSGRKENFSQAAALSRKDPFVEYLGVAEVRFKATIQPSVAVKSFESVEIAVVGLPEGLEVDEPLPLGRLRLQSSKAELRDFVPGANALSVDLSVARKPGVYTVAVKANLPPEFSVEYYEPEALSVRVVARKEASP